MTGLQVSRYQVQEDAAGYCSLTCGDKVEVSGKDCLQVLEDCAELLNELCARNLTARYNSYATGFEDGRKDALEKLTRAMEQAIGT